MQSRALPVNLTAASLEKVPDLQGPYFLSCPFQPPLRAVPCASGLLPWHCLANFSATEEEIVPSVAAAYHGPTAAGRAAKAALSWETNSTVIPIFTQYLSHLCNCQYLPNCHVPDCTCTYFIHVIISFQLHHLA